MLKLSEELWAVILLAEDLTNGLCLRRGKILYTTITRKFEVDLIIISDSSLEADELLKSTAEPAL